MIKEILAALDAEGLALEGSSVLTADHAYWSRSDRSYPLRIYADLEAAKSAGRPYSIRFLTWQQLEEETPAADRARLEDARATSRFDVLGWSEVGEVESPAYAAAQRAFRQVAEPLESGYLEAHEAEARAEFARAHDSWARTRVLELDDDGQEVVPTCDSNLCVDGDVPVGWDGYEERCSRCHGTGQLTREQVMEDWERREPTWASSSSSLRESAARQAVGTIRRRMESGELVLPGWEGREGDVGLRCVIPRTEPLYATVVPGEPPRSDQVADLDVGVAGGRFDA